MIEKIANVIMDKQYDINVFSASEKPSDLTLAEKMNQIFPSVFIMIATLGALCILLIILTKFLYNPVKKMVQRRKDFIKSNIDESIKVKKEAYDLEQEARTKLVESKNISSEIIAKAKIEAEGIKTSYIEQGKEEAARIVREAKDDIKAKKRTLEEESYNEIVSVAIEISEKIIKNRISEKEAKKYLEDYLGRK